MDCPRCASPMPEDIKFCTQCGAPIPKYEAPEGFVYDPDSGQYYRIDYAPDGQPVSATWFDSVAGEYQQVLYEQEPVQPEVTIEPAVAPESEPESPEPAVEAELPSEPVAEPEPPEEPTADTEPEPVLIITSKPEPPAATTLFAAPDGFVYDESSGLYYQETHDFDAQTGMPVRVITWFYPESGQYERINYPGTAPQPVPQQTAQPANKAAGTDGKKKIIIIVSAAVVLVAALAVLAWFMKWPPFSAPEGDDKQTGAAVTAEPSPSPSSTPTPLPSVTPAPTPTPTPTPTPSPSPTPEPEEVFALTSQITTPEEFELALEMINEPDLTLDELYGLFEKIEMYMWENTELLEEYGVLGEYGVESIYQSFEIAISNWYERQEGQDPYGITEGDSLLTWSECDINLGASSTLKASTKYSYEVYNMLDGSTDTAWVEGASGYGIGEWIMLSTASEVSAYIKELSIRNGYQRTDSTYTTNARVKEIAVEFTDGTSFNYTLTDTKDWQVIPIPEGTITRTIKITIVSVYPGTHYEDTCISGISCY